MNQARKLAGSSACAVVALALFHGCVSLTSELSEGERLYRAKCSSCHRLIGPEEHDAPAWRHYVDEYGQGLTREEKNLIFDFLTSSRAFTEGVSATPANENGP